MSPSAVRSACETPCQPLRYVDGFSAQEIAAHLGLAAATVRVHLMKGVRDCAQFFRAHGLLCFSEAP